METYLAFSEGVRVFAVEQQEQRQFSEFHLDLAAKPLSRESHGHVSRRSTATR